MQILFLHDNFPAQFGVLGQYLARNGWDVWFGTQRKGVNLEGLKVFHYAPHRDVTEKIHPYVGGFEKSVLTGQAFVRTALKMKEKGLNPDIVMAHSGWGPGLYVKDVWPAAKYVGYFEWYYNSKAPDVLFLNDVEGTERTLDDDLRTRTRNASIQMDLINCDAGICPTEFQKSQFPEIFHDKLMVMHDGIDTHRYAPMPDAKLKLDNLDLSGVDELITYVARGMEPYRGFPDFMKALEIILKKRPNAHVVIVGEDRVAYGKQLGEGDSFKKRALETLDLDQSRVHFTGLLTRADYLKVIKASSVHVYLTIPFVLSWSMMESMSTGCTLVTSAVPCVDEMAGRERPTMLQVDHRNHKALADSVVRVLDDRAEASALSEAARAHIVENGYGMIDIFPKKMAWLRSLVNKGE